MPQHLLPPRGLLREDLLQRGDLLCHLLHRVCLTRQPLHLLLALQFGTARLLQVLERLLFPQRLDLRQRPVLPQRAHEATLRNRDTVSAKGVRSVVR